MEKQIKDIQTGIVRIDEEYDKTRDELSRVQNENERLTAENEQLRRQIQQGFEEVTISDNEND